MSRRILWAVATQEVRRRYVPSEIEAGLLALVLTGGSTRKAAEMSGVPASTLADWKLDHAERLEQLRVERGEQIEAMAINGLRAFALRAEEVKAAALEATMEQLREGKARDPAAVLRNVATAQGITVSKILELSGRPTSIVEHRSAQDIVARLASLGAVVDSTARELPAESQTGSSQAHTMGSAPSTGSTE